MQVNADGTSILLAVDGVITQTDGDGVTIVTNPDTSFTQTSPDGTSIKVGADGHRVQTFIDGSQIESFTDGTSIETHSDGHRITINPDGTKVQVNPDGTKLNFSAAGALIGGPAKSSTSSSGALPNGGYVGAKKATKKEKKNKKAKKVKPVARAAAPQPPPSTQAASGGGDGDPEVWEKRQDAKKRTYYFMRSKGKTAWELPHGWVQMLDAGTDRVYWYNRDTQESSWSDPNPSAAAPPSPPSAPSSPTEGGGGGSSQRAPPPPVPKLPGSSGGSARGAAATKRGAPETPRGRSGSTITTPFTSLDELEVATLSHNGVLIDDGGTFRVSETNNKVIDGLYDSAGSGRYVNTATSAVIRLDRQQRWVCEKKANGVAVFMQQGTLPWATAANSFSEGCIRLGPPTGMAPCAPTFARIERTRVGTLLKQGGAKSGKRKLPFLERLFELRGTVLRYWKPSRKGTDAAPKGEIMVLGCMCRERVTKGSDRFGFEVAISDHCLSTRTVVLAAATADERAQWMREIRVRSRMLTVGLADGSARVLYIPPSTRAFLVMCRLLHALGVTPSACARFALCVEWTVSSGRTVSKMRRILGPGEIVVHIMAKAHVEGRAPPTLSLVHVLSLPNDAQLLTQSAMLALVYMQLVDKLADGQLEGDALSASDLIAASAQYEFGDLTDSSSGAKLLLPTLASRIPAKTYALQSKSWWKTKLLARWKAHSGKSALQAMETFVESSQLLARFGVETFKGKFGTPPRPAVMGVGRFGTRVYAPVGPDVYARGTSVSMPASGTDPTGPVLMAGASGRGKSSFLVSDSRTASSIVAVSEAYRFWGSARVEAEIGKRVLMVAAQLSANEGADTREEERLENEDAIGSRIASSIVESAKLTGGLNADTEMRQGQADALSTLAEDSIHIDGDTYVCDAWSPRVFASLRASFGVSELSYYRSFQRGVSGGAVGDGKSGMLFFLSKDTQYVVKTLKGRERQVFIKMLPDYLRHMSDHPHSTLCRFFGMYTVKLKGLSAESMEGRPPAGYTVVVMGNALNTSLSIGVKYDLKGSTSKRIVEKEEMMEKAKSAIAKKLEEQGLLPDAIEENLAARDEAELVMIGCSKITLKDLNLTISDPAINPAASKMPSGVMRIAPDVADRLHNQIDADIALLIKYKLMDYSLFVGVHECAADSPALPASRGSWGEVAKKAGHHAVLLADAVAADNALLMRKGYEALDNDGDAGASGGDGPSSRSTVYQQDYGGIRSYDAADGATSERIFYICVIDFLQEYDKSKQAETFLKRQRAEKKGLLISSVPAGEYGERFKDFCRTRIPKTT
tara:strand:+ start:3696 stop:7628 length:3933 start_codon:yes stop_codon:yes gene_type:complete